MTIIPIRPTRDHPQRPVSSPLLAAWDTWWSSLENRPSTEIIGWAINEPSLAGCMTPGDAVVRAQADRVAMWLLGQAQGGSQLAGGIMLQALLPRLVRISSRDPRANVDDYLTEAWLVVMRYPTTRDHAVLTNLALDTLKAISRDRTRQAREIPIDVPPEPDPPASIASPTAHELIDVAARIGIVGDANERVLRAIYTDGLSGREASAKLGISHEMVRYRASQAIKRMRAASDELLAA